MGGRGLPLELLTALARVAAGRPQVVLDDDPTGTQTLRDVPVLTEWSAESIAHLLDGPVLFLSTNSRSLDTAAAVSRTQEAVTAAMAAARARGRPISLVSRSDSTLRGHFPAETSAIADAAGTPDARILLAPYFGEGGRVTIGDTHFLERDGRRVPVGETEYARDPAFGYRASSLQEWVAEKHVAAGRPVPPTVSLPLEHLRAGGPAAVAERLAALPPGGVAIANSEIDADIEVVALGAAMAEEAGVPLVARVAASYVRARAGRPRVALLSAAELSTEGPGIIVVGSHVETTTRQLERLMAMSDGRSTLLELPVELLLTGHHPTLNATARDLEAALRAGRSGVVATERTPRTVGLAGARAISAALASIIRRVRQRPGWVLAKGGITSYDVARHGLAMGAARVAGQLVPGVPVWIGSAASRWPGLALAVFPGNVGGPDTLAEAVALLGGDPQPLRRP